MALHFFDYEMAPVSKTTFCFSVIVLFAVEALQSGYSHKRAAERRAKRHQP